MIPRGFDALSDDPNFDGSSTEFGQSLLPNNPSFWFPSDDFKGLDLPSSSSTTVLNATETEPTALAIEQQRLRQQEDADPAPHPALQQSQQLREQFEQKRQRDEENLEARLKKGFALPVTSEWAEGATKRNLRGFRTTEKAKGGYDGLAYELALKASMYRLDEKLDDRSRGFIEKRFAELTDRNHARLPFWTNEYKLLKNLLTRPVETASIRSSRPVDVTASATPTWGAPHDREILCQFKHWWIYRNGKWNSYDPPADRYGTRPVAAMQNLLLDLMAQWQKSGDPDDVFKEGDTFRVSRPESGHQFQLVVHDRKLQPKNAEIRRVLGLPDHNENEYTSSGVEEIKNALFVRNEVTLGKRPRVGAVKLAKELKIGDRGQLQNLPTVRSKLDLIWTGTEWQPMESWLRRQLGYDLLTKFFRS